MGFCIPPLSPFCSARPENCTQLGRNRILVLLCICEPTCVDLCTIVRVFVYEFLPSRIMVAKTTRLVTRAQYRSVVNVLDNARHTAEELPWLHILDDRIVNFKPNLLRVQMQIVLQERRMFSWLPYLLRWGGRIISLLRSKIPPQNQKGWIVLIAQCEKLIQQFCVFGKIYSLYLFLTIFRSLLIECCLNWIFVAFTKTIYRAALTLPVLDDGNAGLLYSKHRKHLSERPQIVVHTKEEKVEEVWACLVCESSVTSGHSLGLRGRRGSAHVLLLQDPNLTYWLSMLCARILLECWVSGFRGKCGGKIMHMLSSMRSLFLYLTNSLSKSFAWLIRDV